MNKPTALILLSCAIAPIALAADQLVDLNVEIEVGDWHPNGISSWTTEIHCVVGTNFWKMEGDFSRNARVTYQFTGTNIVEESVITKDLSADLKRLNQPGMPFMTAPAIGSRNTRLVESIDGNPGRTVRQGDQLTPVARIGWLAFCSSPCLKRDGRNIFPPSDLWKELVRASTFKDKTAVFDDELGLPKTMDLFATNGQQVMQYRVTSSTNILDWEFPLEFQLVQYRPAPVPEQPGLITGTNGWQVELLAKGKVKSIEGRTGALNPDLHSATPTSPNK